ncbi:hypothetical protein DFJ77DRAFT_473138 [Powellomyces hirtus]|nr:hypothetical protein DFJ77DRAFT_473138 [Powellomyces hirtus]
MVGTSEPKRPKMTSSASLQSLPSELYSQIAMYLSLFDVLNLTRITRRIRSSLRTPAFGKAFLEKDESNLSFEMVLSMPVSGLDKFDLGVVAESFTSRKEQHTEAPPEPTHATLRSTTYFIHHRTADTSDIHFLEVSPTGSFKLWSKPLPISLTCSLSPTLGPVNGGFSEEKVDIPVSHRETCSFCSRVKTGKICFSVDKQYRVFFQSWVDSYVFNEKDRATVRFAVVHQNDGVGGWNAASASRKEWYRQFERKVLVSRYGLTQAHGRGRGLERFFGLSEEEATTVSPRGTSAELRNGRSFAPDSATLYNPWA